MDDNAVMKATRAIVELLAMREAKACKALPVEPNAAYVEGFKAGFDAGVEAQRAASDPGHPSQVG